LSLMFDIKDNGNRPKDIYNSKKHHKGASDLNEAEVHNATKVYLYKDITFSVVPISFY